MEPRGSPGRPCAARATHDPPSRECERRLQHDALHRHWRCPELPTPMDRGPGGGGPGGRAQCPATRDAGEGPLSPSGAASQTA